MHSLGFTFLCISVLLKASASNDFEITPTPTSSGLYYEKIGDVLLSNSKWQFVTSVDYQGYLLFYEYLFNQSEKIQEFCQKTDLEECNTRYDSIRSNLDRIQERDESMANFLGITRTRVKRFWSKIGRFFSKVGKGLVGLVGQFIGGGSGGRVDLSAYDRQLDQLSIGQRELENQVNLQRTMFLVDSERKQFQIDWLKKTQTDIEDKIATLEGTFQKDSEKKEKEIKELKTMLDETNEKIKKQEEIQKKLIGQVDKIETKLLQVDEDIKYISNKIANNTERIDKQELQIKLNTITIDFGFLMNQFETEQKILYDVIKNANQGNLDPYVLTPLNLVQMLQNIYPDLPEDMTFPLYPNIENANKLYKIIKPSVYLYNTKVIFILQIPLVHSKTYRIHKMTSLPQYLGDGKFAFILPQQPYLIIDKAYHEYTLLSSDELKDYCDQIAESKYLCRQIHQISLSYDSQDCEVVMFKSPKKIPSSCDIRLLHLDKPIFLQLQQPNAWIYAVPDRENIMFNCGNEKSTSDLKGTGFVQVRGDCIVRTPNFELLSLVEFFRPVESNYSAAINLSTMIDQSYVEEIEDKSLIRKRIIFPFDFNELEKHSVSLKRTATSLSGLYYTLLVFLILFLCIMGYLVYKRKITLEKIQTHAHTAISGIRSRIPTFGRSVSSSCSNKLDSDRVQVRLKLKNSDDLKRISVHQEDSTDPDAEYVTVRFKTRKQNEEKPLNNLKSSEEEDVKLLNKNISPVMKDKVFKESNVRYLNELKNVLDVKQGNK